MRLAMANRASPVMGCMPGSLITTTTTWSRRSICYVTEGLKVDHVRLFMGMSMGCMHAFRAGSAYVRPVGGEIPRLPRRGHAASLFGGRDRWTQSHFP